ncbi:MAG: endopeptidase La [Cellulosilyticaceae bacterium]
MNEKQYNPLIKLTKTTIFPNMIIHFDVGQEKYLRSLKYAMENDKKLILVNNKNDNKTENLYEIGMMVHIRQIIKLKTPIVKVLVQGISRVRILEVTDEEYLSACVEVIEEEIIDKTTEIEAYIRVLKELFAKYSDFNKKISKTLVENTSEAEDANEVLDLISASLLVSFEEKQSILETISFKDRIIKVINILKKENEILEIQDEINKEVKKNIEKVQREYYLREQLKVIKKELGENNTTEIEINEYKSKMEGRNIPEIIKNKLDKEFSKLEKLSQQSQERGIVKTYIETLLELPWGVETTELQDLSKAREILERDHYGMKKIKQRLIEYLAVKNKMANMSAPVICLVGPPGVGKTSIAKSIAEAVGRNYIRIALGGVRDEADIRGHRRTYIGAMPGRFVNGIIQSKSFNPVIVLDEVDKMMGDFRGDPAAALLEILDTAQNYEFRDHYLEVPIDCSKAMFVLTANTLSTIPRPLLDRMEIIEISSYTQIEKKEIAKRYLIPKNLKKHGIEKSEFKMRDTALEFLIDGYTREAGVRDLERKIASISRKAMTELIEEEKKNVIITSKKVKQYLGNVPYRAKEKNEKSQIGVVRGLAWTRVGGETLSIEVNVVPGRGQLELTGNMGNVMKESAKAAISYVRSRVDTLQIDSDFYKNTDINLHIPEGAIPKDGPSAGIAMASAIISALTKKPIRHDIAMTGEITITGRVLAIGGLKEKILAAKRVGIFDIIVPAENELNVEELEKEILEKMNIVYATTMDDVLKYVFEVQEEK